METLAFMNLGPPELILIFCVIVLLFGAKKLPGLARALGKSMSEFKAGKQEGGELLSSSDDKDQDESSSTEAKEKSSADAK
jgi:sec-independent protein translocase protein TatA